MSEGRLKEDPSRNGDVVVTLHEPCNAARKAALDDLPGIAKSPEGEGTAAVGTRRTVLRFHLSQGFCFFPVDSGTI